MVRIPATVAASPTWLTTACSETRRKYVHVGLFARVHAGDSLRTDRRKPCLIGSIARLLMLANVAAALNDAAVFFCLLPK
jgi:hypothetical protein